MNQTARTLRTLETALELFPQLRIGQIIFNAIPDGMDYYYLSDLELQVYLLRYIEENNKEE